MLYRPLQRCSLAFPNETAIQYNKCKLYTETNAWRRGRLKSFVASDLARTRALQLDRAFELLLLYYLYYAYAFSYRANTEFNGVTPIEADTCVNGIKDNIKYTDIRWNEIMWNDIRWNAMWDDIRWNEIMWNDIRWNAMWDDIRWNEIMWNDVRWSEMMQEDVKCD